MNNHTLFLYYKIFLLVLYCIPMNILSMEIITLDDKPIEHLHPTTKKFLFFSIHQKPKTYIKKKIEAQKIKNERDFLDAASNNNTKKLMQLINHVDVNAQCAKTHNTALHYAAHHGNEAIVNILIEKSAYTNIRNSYGTIPLHLAAYEGHVEIGKILIENWKDANIQNNDGYTPLYCVTHSLIICKKDETLKKKNLIQFIELLLNNGALISFKDKERNGPDNEITLAMHTPSNEQSNQSKSFSTKEEREFIYQAHALLLRSQLEKAIINPHRKKCFKNYYT